MLLPHSAAPPPSAGTNAQQVYAAVGWSTTTSQLIQSIPLQHIAVAGSGASSFSVLHVMDITMWCVAFGEHTQNNDGLTTMLRVMSQPVHFLNCSIYCSTPLLVVWFAL